MRCLVPSLSVSVYRHLPLGEDESWAVALLLLVFYAHAYWLVSQIEPSLAPWMGIALSVAVSLLYQLAARRLPACGTTRSAGANRALSRSQLPRTEVGATSSAGRRSLASDSSRLVRYASS